MVGDACCRGPSAQASPGVGRVKKDPRRALARSGGRRIADRTSFQCQSESWTMPVLSYLADTNVVSDFVRGEKAVLNWFANHPDEIGVSTQTLAELRRGIELK